MPQLHPLLGAQMPEELRDIDLSPAKLAAIVAGHVSIDPKRVVWGNQRELVRKFEHVICLRKDVLDRPIEEIIFLVDRACSVEEIGRSWKGTSVKKAQRYRHIEVIVAEIEPDDVDVKPASSGIADDGKRYFEPVPRKICATCKLEKDKSKFHRRSRHLTGLQSNCIKCTEDKRKARMEGIGNVNRKAKK